MTLEGTLPQQLLVETLHSLQSIIFPLADPKSVKVLKQLIDKREFDPLLSEYTGYNVYSEIPEGFKYRYWGERIAILNELLVKKPPKTRLERWIQWQASESNALLIALLALLISIIVGVISIVISALQLWLTWLAWKHPTPGH